MFDLGALIGGVATIGGALIGASANRRAASQAASGAERAAQIQADAALEAVRLNNQAAAEARREMREAAARGIAAIRAGTAGYRTEIEPLLLERPVMLPTYRGLTEAQRIGREDLRREATARLAASGLRGAGRAGVGVLLDADRRYVSGAVDRNDDLRLSAMQAARNRADAARSGLASILAQEGGAIANTEIGQGNRIGENIADAGRFAANQTSSVGRSSADAVLDAARAAAGATTANAALYGQALGSLGGVIASGLKNYNRYGATSQVV